MLKKELIEKNPIRHLNVCTESNVSSRMGLVISRAGLGKTAILVQIALDSLLNGKQVIHVSVGQSLEKTRIWYDDMFKDIAAGCKLDNPYEVYDEIMHNRMIMTFKESKLSRAKLEERMNDLVYQNVIRPSCLVIDGYDLACADQQFLADLKEMGRAMDLQVWFSALSHRDDQRVSNSGVPAPCHEVEDLFDTVIVLQPAPKSECIDLNIVKDTTGVSKCGKVLKLDPITFMIKEGC
ncbi:MAG: hypothetical protein AB1413_06255 [Thermodesulfobacteriota bacterium]